MMTNESLLVAAKVLFAGIVIAIVVAIMVIRGACAAVWRLARD
jgi:hypothetical protein